MINNLIYTLFLVAMVGIWLLLLLNVILLYGGYQFSREMDDYKIPKYDEKNITKKVSVMIPAHNEEIVIRKTLIAMCELNYPKELLEIIVINDNSKDSTGKEINKVIKENPESNIIHLEIIGDRGGKGKSNALNLGYEKSTGEYLAIYDADNTPNRNALYYLVHTMEKNNKNGAVIGKFRTRNKKRNILTSFINIETLSFQWMAQAGRWKYFKLCTIPGTNFLIRRSIIDRIGGWDINAIAEDTEVSLRVYNMGYQIEFMPKSETYEQEPETVRVWIKQRSRWVSGNFYVLFKNILSPRSIKSPRVIIDLAYFFIVYILFLTAIVVSDIIFVLGIFTNVEVDIPNGFYIIWVLSYIIFLFQIAITLSIEKGEVNKRNILLIALMYFTYCQLWLVASLRGFYMFIKDNVIGKGSKWYKTERF